MADDLNLDLSAFAAAVEKSTAALSSFADALGKILAPAGTAPAVTGVPVSSPAAATGGINATPPGARTGGGDKTPNLTNSIGQIFGGAVARLLQGLQQSFQAFSPKGGGKQDTDKLGEAAQKAVSPINACADAMRVCASAVQDLVQHLGGALTAVEEKPTLVEPIKEGKEGGGEAGGGLSSLAAGIGGAVTAVTAAIAAVQQVIAQLTEWVQALAPGTVAEFNRALRDLKATLGVAFTPVFEILTGTIRQAAGIILPVMQQLKPVIEQLTQTFSAQLIQTVRQVAEIFSSLVPILNVLAAINEAFASSMRLTAQLLYVTLLPLILPLQLLAAILTPVVEALKIFDVLMDGLNEIIRVLDVVFRTMVQTLGQFIKGLFGGLDVGKVMDFLQKTILKVIEYMLLFIATIAKIFGQDKFLGNLIDNLKEKPGATAQGEFSFKGFEQVNKDIALAAAQAAGGGAQAKKFDLGDVVKKLEDLKDGNNPILEKLQFLVSIKEKVEQIYSFIQKVGETVTHPFSGSGGGVFGSAARGALGTLPGGGLVNAALDHFVK